MAQFALFHKDNSRKLCENAQGEALLLNQFWINATHPSLVIAIKTWIRLAIFTHPISVKEFDCKCRKKLFKKHISFWNSKQPKVSKLELVYELCISLSNFPSILSK